MKRQGNLSNSVYKRTVLKNISGKGRKTVFPPGAGAYRDGSIVHDLIQAQGSGRFALEESINKVKAGGGHPLSISFSILLPESASEKVVGDLVRSVSEKIREKGLYMGTMDVRVLNCINEIYMSAVCVGQVRQNIFKGYEDTDVLNIIMTGSVGMAGARILIDLKREEIGEKYTTDLIEKAYSAFDGCESTDIEKCLEILDMTAVKALGEGGVWGGLWDISESMKMGLSVEGSKIPVCQEIIEICEMFGINPYILNSTGSFLLVSKNAEEDIRILEENKIKAVIIGEMTENNNKIIRNRNMTRFLDKPAMDEVYRISDL